MFLEWILLSQLREFSLSSIWLFPWLICKVNDFNDLRTNIQIDWCFWFDLNDLMLVLLIILNLKLNSLNEWFPLTNIDVEIFHFAWELKLRCKTNLISNLLVVINFSSFNINHWIKLVIKIVNEVKRNSKGMESEWRLTDSRFRFLFRNLSFKISVEFSITKYYWFSFFNWISILFIFVQLMNTCSIFSQRRKGNHFHFIINRIFLSWFKQIKRIFHLLL